MDDADACDIELPTGRLYQLLHFFEGHGFVRLVNQVKRLAAFCELAYVAVERDGGSALGRDDPACNRFDGDRAVCEFEEVQVSSLRLGSVSLCEQTKAVIETPVILG